MRSEDCSRIAVVSRCVGFCAGVLTLVSCVMAQTGMAGSAGVDRLPCADAVTQAESTACWSREARAAEAQAAEAFDRLTETLGSQAAATSSLAATAEEQWVRYRDASCALQAARFGGGSAAPRAVAICRWRLARAHAADLRVIAEEWKLPR